ncbi:tetratricopeptide repeat protein [Desulfobacterales bacterium]|nr:tetratricopeptide repeat protein [Desulfobacterales bacterium]
MSKKISKAVPTMAKQTAMIIAAISFLIGFFAGVGFAVYKATPDPVVSSSSNTEINYSQMAKDLVNEVLDNPQNTNAWIQLGHIYFDTDKYDQAINAYEKALELNPNDADVLTDLGIMYRRSHQPRKALEKFDKAITVDPKHENSRLNKGIVLMNDLGDRDGAVQAWEELLEINPVAMFNNDQSLDQIVKHYKEGHDKNTSN